MERDGGYRAAIGSAAVFDRSGRGKIAVAGNDRRTYLHAMLTNDIATLGAGSGCYAAYLTPQGRMIADMRLLEVGDLVLLDVAPEAAATVLENLDRFVFSEDVKLGDLTDAFGEVSIVGPDAARVVSDAVAGAPGAPGADELAAWPEFRNARNAFRGETVLVAATRDAGVPGFDLYVERPHVPALVDALVAAGATRATGETWETLRVEAGRPAFPVDMGTDTIPLEAGIEARAISFSKGCYPGQEVIVRVVQRGHGRVARRLVGLRVEGGEVPAAGDLLRAGERDAGRVTSAVWSPRLDRPIALAMVHRDLVEPGTGLTVAHGGRSLDAAVVSLPFEANS